MPKLKINPYFKQLFHSSSFDDVKLGIILFIKEYGVDILIKLIKREVVGTYPRPDFLYISYFFPNLNLHKSRCALKLSDYCIITFGPSYHIFLVTGWMECKKFIHDKRAEEIINYDT